MNMLDSVSRQIFYFVAFISLGRVGEMDFSRMTWGDFFVWPPARWSAMVSGQGRSDGTLWNDNFRWISVGSGDCKASKRSYHREECNWKHDSS